MATRKCDKSAKKSEEQNSLPRPPVGLNLAAVPELQTPPPLLEDEDILPEESPPEESPPEESPPEESPPEEFSPVSGQYFKEKSEWRNKQRVLLLASRGIPARGRHLLTDLKNLLPHHKTESKWDKHADFQEIAEVAECSNCNNVMFLEARKGIHMYLWMAKLPAGPTIKFQVHNIHTMGELNMTGNCLKYSRPVLSFAPVFSQEPHLRLMRELIIQMMGTPLHHPKSKPFVDHIMQFTYYDHKIHFRHYSAGPTSEKGINHTQRFELDEIGPRFVLDPIRIFDGRFGGPTVFKNMYYVSPLMLRKRLAEAAKDKVLRNMKARERSAANKKKHRLAPDPLAFDKVFSDIESDTKA